MTKTYEVTLNGGEAGETLIQAGNVRGAMRQAREWARGGDWGDADNPPINPTSDDYVIIRIFRPSERLLAEESFLPSDL